MPPSARLQSHVLTQNSADATMQDCSQAALLELAKALTRKTAVSQACPSHMQFGTRQVVFGYHSQEHQDHTALLHLCADTHPDACDQVMRSKCAHLSTESSAVWANHCTRSSWVAAKGRPRSLSRPVCALSGTSSASPKLRSLSRGSA